MKEREEREAARAAEKERKRLEALAAKRYPIDDLELLQELAERAEQYGEAGFRAQYCQYLVTMIYLMKPSATCATHNIPFSACRMIVCCDHLVVRCDQNRSQRRVFDQFSNTHLASSINLQ